ncbi:MAG TPA: hypothetical protein VFN68_05435 [Acidimicrobiales bacterium]|nr:hypothetical protein [Acidimicrobiales bacterium]
MTPGWRVERVSGPAGDLHAGSAELLQRADLGRTARILVADAPAVVLGSHQPEEWFDPEALERAGLGLARRRSGGGAVLVGAGRVVWVDFVVTADDPLWDDDVARATWWVGELWVDVLVAAGVADRADLAVWKGRMRASRWSPVVCFAGLGPGEVELHGRKVIGVSQRRTRRAALFQSAALLDWEPGLWLAVLSDAGRQAVDDYRPGGGPPADLAGAARGLDADREGEVLSAVCRRLMT